MIADIGVAIGVVGGIFYSWFVLWALRSWWVGAVTVPFLTFHWTIQSLLIGAIAGWLVAALTLAVTVRSLTRAQAQTLLSGRDIDTASGRTVKKSKLPTIAVTMAITRLRLPGLAQPQVARPLRGHSWAAGCYCS